MNFKDQTLNLILGLKTLELQSAKKNLWKNIRVTICLVSFPYFNTTCCMFLRYFWLWKTPESWLSHNFESDWAWVLTLLVKSSLSLPKIPNLESSLGPITSLDLTNVNKGWHDKVSYFPYNILLLLLLIVNANFLLAKSCQKNILLWNPIWV